MADDARLKAPFVSLGVAPEAGGSYTLPATMGWQAAAYAFFTTDWIDAPTAVATGLALRGRRRRPGPRGDAGLLARRIAAMPLVSLVETKQLMLAAKLDQVRAARAREDEVFGRLTGRARRATQGRRAAATAFLQRSEALAERRGIWDTLRGTAGHRRDVPRDVEA